MTRCAAKFIASNSGKPTTTKPSTRPICLPSDRQARFVGIERDAPAFRDSWRAARVPGLHSFWKPLAPGRDTRGMSGSAHQGRAAGHAGTGVAGHWREGARSNWYRASADRHVSDSAIAWDGGEARKHRKCGKAEGCASFDQIRK